MLFFRVVVEIQENIPAWKLILVTSQLDFLNWILNAAYFLEYVIELVYREQQFKHFVHGHLIYFISSGHRVNWELFLTVIYKIKCLGNGRRLILFHVLFPALVFSLFLLVTLRVKVGEKEEENDCVTSNQPGENDREFAFNEYQLETMNSDRNKLSDL